MAGRGKIYQDDFPEQARKLCAQFGAIDTDLATFFGVKVRAIHRWKVKYPEFAEACKVGKEPADDRVEESLFKRAVGFHEPTVKLFQYQGDVIEKKCLEYYPPDTKAAIFWLCNRRRDKWNNAHMRGMPFGSDDELPESVPVEVIDGRAKPD